MNTVIKWRGDVYFGTDSGLKVVDGVMSQRKTYILIKKTGGDPCTLSDGGQSGKSLDMYFRRRCLESVRGWITPIYPEKDGLLGDKFGTAMELKDGTIALAGDLGISFVKNENGE